MAIGRDMEDKTYEEVVEYVKDLIKRDRPFPYDLCVWIQNRHPGLVVPFYARQGYTPKTFPL